MMPVKIKITIIESFRISFSLHQNILWTQRYLFCFHCSKGTTVMEQNIISWPVISFVFPYSCEIVFLILLKIHNVSPARGPQCNVNESVSGGLFTHVVFVFHDITFLSWNKGIKNPIMNSPLFGTAFLPLPVI